MRIGVVLPRLDGGGAERGAVGWSTGLVERGHEVTLLTHLGDPQTAPDGLDHVHMPALSGPRYWAGLPRWLRQVQAQRRFDVVVGVLELSNLAVVAAFSGRADAPAVLVSEHNVNSVYLPTQGLGARGKLGLSRRLYRHAHGVVAISHAVATDLVVRFGVPTDRLYVVPIPLSNWDSPYRVGEPAAGVRMAVVGRVASQKRPERVLDVLEELARRGIEGSAVVIGEGPLRAGLEAEARRRWLSVDFPGWVPDWRAHATDATCLLLPSDFEGLGLVLLEAAAMGLPSVAASSALAVGDAVIPGVTGALALSTSATHLADAVAEAEAVGRGQIADPRWLQQFAPERTAERLEQVCEAAQARRSR